MAKRVSLSHLSKLSFTPQKKLQTPASLCTLSSPDKTQIEETPTIHTNDKNESFIHDHECHQQQLQKLSAFIQQGQFVPAENLTTSLLFSKSPLAPSDLFTLFSHNSPSLKLVFSNFLLSLLAKSKMHGEALGLYKAIRKEGRIEKADEVLQKEIEKGFVPDEVVYNTIVNGYCRMGDTNKAISTVEAMEKLGLKPDCVTFNTLIDKFCQLKEMKYAKEWVKLMREKGVAPNVETYNILINGYGRMCQLDRCFVIIEEMENSGIKPNVASYGSLINSLCKDGKLLEADLTFRDMISRGVLPNVLIYNMLIDGYCTVGKLKDAFRFYDEMVEGETRPTIVTYNTLMNGLCKKGRTKGLGPKADTYNLLIGEYCEQKDFVGAYFWYREMFENNFLPSFTACNELVIGLREQGRLQEADIICSEMKAKGMDDSSSDEGVAAVAKV
ncbi:hypothetical protein COLO4_29826 [Corchorus olitorius]|uniref:Pentacotripeptide-repeat region of PRORP domain-containing protein n=1 Tax=Corchorus olitorius TaxID=93759 RepID=A0A1R3HCZ4_9ROSI|nr:hypothetical protein COLO4_29826 [Corchorus olitorius]